MMEFPSYPAARDTLLRRVRPVGTEHVPLSAALGRVLLRTTAVEDGNPNWTDEVLCRAFPDYAGSAERRARLEAALARIPPSPA